jgi:biotin transport system substrate-specific component
MDSTITVRRPAVLADLIPGARLRDVALVVGAAGFVGVLAQIVIHLSFTPVPITGQTLGVLVAGTSLGWRRAAASMALYLAVGSAGLPWFQSGTSGWQGASEGYLFGFMLAAIVCGAYAGRGSDRSIFGSIPTMLVGEVCIYVVGVPWLAIDLHVGLAKAIALGFTPFVIGDAIKLGLAAGLLPTAWRFAKGKDRTV